MDFFFNLFSGHWAIRAFTYPIPLRYCPPNPLYLESTYLSLKINSGIKNIGSKWQIDHMHLFLETEHWSAGCPSTIHAHRGYCSQFPGEQILSGLSKAVPRTDTASLLPHSIQQSKSQGQLRFQGMGDYLLMGAWGGEHVHTGMEEMLAAKFKDQLLHILWAKSSMVK